MRRLHLGLRSIKLSSNKRRLRLLLCARRLHAEHIQAHTENIQHNGGDLAHPKRDIIGWVMARDILLQHHRLVTMLLDHETLRNILELIQLATNRIPRHQGLLNIEDHQEMRQKVVMSMKEYQPGLLVSHHTMVLRINLANITRLQGTRDLHLLLMVAI
jgi:hypothetical protein